MNLRRLRQIWKRRIWVYVLRYLHSEVEVQVGDRRMVVDLKDDVIGRLLYLYGEYEADFQGLMQYMNLRGSVCVDIGANIGLHTIVMSDLVGGSGKVFAFEPESHNFRLLEHNLRINRVTNTVVHQQAVGDKEGVCSLTLNPSNYGDHRVSIRTSKSEASQETLLTTIDSSLQDVPSGAIKVIKIDVQGYEYQVIRGMVATIMRNRDAIMMIEVFPEALRAAGSSATELMQYLFDLGLTGWELHPYRILPVSEPWIYEFIHDGKDVNLLLSRNPTLLKTVLFNWYEHSSNSSRIPQVKFSENDVGKEREGIISR